MHAAHLSNVHPAAMSAVAGMLVVAAVVITGCGSSTPTAGANGSGPSSSAAATGSKSPAIESNPPGDIPDQQAFVSYRDKGFSLSVPEGWAMTSGATVRFSDKYNLITVQRSAASTAPSTSTVRRDEVPVLSAGNKAFVLGRISVVTRRSGPAVLLTYQALSDVNPVTNKVTTQAVERYEFWRAGTTVTVTLAAPVGSDNVDPWRKVTDSFAWTGP